MSSSNATASAGIVSQANGWITTIVNDATAVMKAIDNGAVMVGGAAVILLVIVGMVLSGREGSTSASGKS